MILLFQALLDRLVIQVQQDLLEKPEQQDQLDKLDLPELYYHKEPNGHKD